MRSRQSGGGTASERWRRLVTDRLEEMQRLSPDREPVSGRFWDRRAGRFAAAASLTDMETDPFLRRVRAATDGSSTAIDVGAGTGRYALALASGIERVTAVDPSSGMLALLRREASRRRVKNVTTIESTWDEATVSPADVVFSSFVLTLVADAPGFVRKLEENARRHVFLYLGAYTGDAVLDPMWRHFHGAPRVPGASYLDALAVLDEIGIEPDVKMVEIPNRRRFATVDEAVEYYRDGLVLADNPEVRRELADLLKVWLLGRRGAYRSPLRSVPAAIIHWRPGARAA